METFRGSGKLEGMGSDQLWCVLSTDETLKVFYKMLSGLKEILLISTNNFQEKLKLVVWKFIQLWSRPSEKENMCHWYVTSYSLTENSSWWWKIKIKHMTNRNDRRIRDIETLWSPQRMLTVVHTNVHELDQAQAVKQPIYRTTTKNITWTVQMLLLIIVVL